MKPDASEKPKLNCYGLTREEWDAVCEISSAIHIEMIQVEPGEDAFDEESRILTQGMVSLVKRIAALCAGGNR